MKRARRSAEAAALERRLAAPLAAANATRTPAQLAAIARENDQNMGIVSYAPSPAVAKRVREDGNADDIGWRFVEEIGARCNALLDAMGAPAAPAPSATDDAPAFAWRGETARDVFGASSVATLAEKLCREARVTQADLAGVDLAARGKDGVSILDWAMACGDEAAVGTLLDSGFDVTAPGLFGKPPLLRAGADRNVVIVRALLARGAPANVMGPGGAALQTAYDPQRADGGETYLALRAAGATLDYPAFDWSMWRYWSSVSRWREILDAWSEFRSDPVALGRTLSAQEETGVIRGDKAAFAELKQRLVAEHRVCFPVPALIELTRDEREFFVQKPCPSSP